MTHEKEFQELVAADRRLMLLRYLDKESDGRMSVSLMQDALGLVGHTVPRLTVMQDAGYLEGLGLVRMEYIDIIPMLRILPRGEDVAHGRTMAPGVKRPDRSED